MIIYPSPDTCSIFIGKFLLESCYRISFNRVRNTTPIVGYKDKKPRDYAIGAAIASGDLIINFLHPGYLTKVIQESQNLTDYKTELQFIKNDVANRFSERANLLFKGKHINKELIKQLKAIRQEEELDSPVSSEEKFDITIFYHKNPKWTRKLIGCQITAEGEAIEQSPAPAGSDSSSGAPIMEKYAFIVDDIKTYKMSEFAQGKTTSKVKPSSNERI